MDLRVTTWNVNSIRLRLDGLAALAEAHAPDVICLQETKVRDEEFPRDACAALGYRHAVINGYKGQSGVAIVSRLPLAECTVREWCGRADGRHAAATLPNGIEVNAFYVPSGGNVPDPQVNDKFAHKLRFLGEMTNWFAARSSPLNRFVLVGDLNVAPLESDVWSHRALANVVSHTPVEIEALGRCMAAHRWIDAVRRLIPPEQPLYSWWSYRAHDWEASDRGRRLDHVWLTPALGDALKSVEVLREARGWAAPSDHVPITVTLAP